MIRRMMLFAVIVILLVAVGSPGRVRADAPKGDITFYVYGDDAEKAAYQTLVSAFNQKYPNVTVKLVHTPGEDEFHLGDEEDAYRERLNLDFASGKPPDVFLMSYREYHVFADKGLTEPLGPYLDKSSIIKAGDFYPEALAPFTRNNVLDCVPQNVSGAVMYYNKALFDKAGLKVPTADWTWDDFLKDAQALTIRANGKTQQFGVGTEVSFARLMPFIWQMGSGLVDDPAKPTRLNLDTPGAKQAFQFFVDLQGKYHVTPSEVEAQSEGIETQFLNGTMGMLIFSRRITPALRTVSFDWDVAPLPQNKTSATLLYSDGYCMAQASKNKDAAWALIEYANSPDGQTVLAKTGRSVPSLKDVANSPAFIDPNVKPQNSQLFLDIIPTLHTSPALPNWADVEEEANRQVESAFYGDISVDQAIQAIDSIK